MLCPVSHPERTSGLQGEIAPARLRLQGATPAEIIEISEQFENASPLFQDVAGTAGYEFRTTGFNSPEEENA
jgi:hypothetical protein